MATENLVTAIGTTTIDGETKVRFTADLATRVKSWSREGIAPEFVVLPEPMTRLDALRYLQAQPEYQTPDRARAILEQIILKEAVIRRDERRAKRQARKSGESTITLSAIRSRKSNRESAEI